MWIDKHGKGVLTREEICLIRNSHCVLQVRESSNPDDADLLSAWLNLAHCYVELVNIGGVGLYRLGVQGCADYESRRIWQGASLAMVDEEDMPS